MVGEVEEGEGNSTYYSPPGQCLYRWEEYIIAIFWWSWTDVKLENKTRKMFQKYFCADQAGLDSFVRMGTVLRGERWYLWWSWHDDDIYINIGVEHADEGGFDDVNIIVNLCQVCNGQFELGSSLLHGYITDIHNISQLN